MVDDYRSLYAFAVECARSLTFSSADATAMGVKNALFVLKLDALAKPDDVAAKDTTKDADPEPPKKTEKTK